MDLQARVIKGKSAALYEADAVEIDLLRDNCSMKSLE